MRTRLTVVILAVVLGIAAAAYGTSCCPSHAGGVEEKAKAEEAEMTEMPFGGEKDVAFAEALWAAMDGYDGWMMQSEIMPGKSPHGMFVRLYYSIVNVDGMPYHVVVKDNYGGEGVTLEMVKESPADYLMAVTPMLQRERGYDPDNKDWFWVKFSPDGSIDKTDKDVAIAGRFAKGMPMGCIACHANAGGGDYLFAND